MRRAMTYARDFHALVAPVCEDRSLRGEGVMAEGLRTSWLGLPRPVAITSTSAMGPPTSSCYSRRSKVGAMSKSRIATLPWIMLTS